MEDKFYLTTCRYVSKNFEKDLSNIIHFQHDGLGFGECSVKYEYIVTFRKFEETKTFLMTTFVNFKKIYFTKKFVQVYLEFEEFIKVQIQNERLLFSVPPASYICPC